MNRMIAAVAVGVFISLVAGCQKDKGSAAMSDSGAGAGMMAVANIAPAAAASTMPAWGQPMGKVTFTQEGKRVHVVADLTGLPAGKHGIHIHEKGNLASPDLASAGPHFNPGHHAHGGPSTSPVHEGDLGNITADASGTAHLDLMVDDISVGTGGPNDVVGRSVIVHAKADDLSSQPAGNSGARIAGGVIEAAK